MTPAANLTALWNETDAGSPDAGEHGTGRGAVRGMADNDTVALRPGPKGLLLRGHRGTFLVTQEGDPLDHVLEPGDELPTRRRGLVVVWALTEGSIEMAPVRP